MPYLARKIGIVSPYDLRSSSLSNPIVSVKRLTPYLLILALIWLAACHPSAPKPVPPTPAQPSSEPSTTSASTPVTTTASSEVSIGPATATASATFSVPVEQPPPLLGPSTATGSPTVIPTPEIATTSVPVVVTPPAPVKITAIRILAPAGQISDGVRQELATKLGLDVQIDTYSSNDEALQKLGAATASYPLALVSYRIVPTLISGQKLAALPTLVPTLQPSPKYLHHFFDRDNKYALPYAFSLAGMAVRSADIKTPVNQWSHLFSEANWKQAQLPGDEGLTTSLLVKAGLRNSSLATAVPAAKEEGSSPIQVDSVACLKKRYATQPGWRFVLPGEGSVIFMYCAVIPANSPSPEKSVAVLNEFFHPEVTARLAEENYLGVTQPAAFKLLPAASTGDALIYPPERIQNNCIFIRSGFRPTP